MADDELTGRRPTPSDEAPVEDLRGEDLVSNVAAETDPEPYRIADDETTAEELTDPEPGGAEEMVADEEQLEAATHEAELAPSTRPRKVAGGSDPAGAAVATAEPAIVARSTRPRKVARPTEVEKKDHATPKQRRTATGEKKEHVGPVTFVNQCIAELKQVVWPTGSQMSQYFVVVLVFVLFIIAFVGLLDFAFGWALLKLLG